MRYGSGLVLVSVIMSHHCENAKGDGIEWEDGIERYLGERYKTKYWWRRLLGFNNLSLIICLYF